MYYAIARVRGFFRVLILMLLLPLADFSWYGDGVHGWKAAVSVPVATIKTVNQLVIHLTTTGWLQQNLQPLLDKLKGGEG